MGTTRSTRDAMRRSADVQVKATQDASAAQVRASVDSARATADQQELLVNRARVEEAVKATLEKPQAQAEVSVEAQGAEPASTTNRKRRAQFGTGGYSSGARI